MSPVDFLALESILRHTKFDKDKSNFLVSGFRDGFDLGYRGPKHVKRFAPNLKFTVGNSTILWNKVMDEVKLKRYAGPYLHPPFEYFIQSPIGLVPKDGNKTRLIFHLSYPRHKSKNISVNANTPSELSSVQYQDFDCAVRLCLRTREGVCSRKK